MRAAALRPPPPRVIASRSRTVLPCQAVGQAASGAGRELPERSNPNDGAFEFHTRGRTADLNVRCPMMRVSPMGRSLPTAGVGSPVAQLGGQLSGGEIAHPAVAGRPTPDLRGSPKLPDAQRWLFVFRFHEAGVRDLRQPATSVHSATAGSGWPDPASCGGLVNCVADGALSEARR